MAELFNLHKCLFTLNYNNEIKDHAILFIDKDNLEKKIKIDRIEISSSPISCKIYDDTGKRHIIPFIRIKKVFKKDELVFDNTDVDLSNSKIIKGFK